jgi:putative helicase MOV10L1/helicase MOV-10
MDSRPPPRFVLPGRSKPIPIVNPLTEKPLSPNIARQPSVDAVPPRDASRKAEISGDRPQSRAPIIGQSNQDISPPRKDSSTPRKPRKKSKWEERITGSIVETGTGTISAQAAKATSDELDRGFDVYATPFVPDELKRINRLGGIIYETPSLKHINFGLYVTESLHPSLLPPLQPVAEPIANDKEPRLVPQTYEQFFRHHLEEEIRFQQEENASYSLYDHPGVVKFQPDGTAQCTITVPGLKENSPYVEDDDVIEIRQLRSEDLMKLSEAAETKAWPPPATAHHSQPWTGIVFWARVSAVIRVKEMLILRVNGLTIQSSEALLGHPQHMPLPTKTDLKLNIQFPVPRERYLPMEHVLSQIQASLTTAGNITYNSHAIPEGSPEEDTQRNQFWIQSMLFPTEADSDVQFNLHSGQFDQPFDVAINWEQKKAVENICSQNYGVIPYLISGPPGTGKTKTLIETALQLIRNVDKVSHILICAPSEPASDTLATRLKQHMKPHELLRLNRPTRPSMEVPDVLLPYCHTANDIFALPSFAHLMTYKIVVTSCRDASMLMYGRMTNSDLYAVEHGLRSRIHPFDPPPLEVRLHWDALLIDEAAQAKEPEALVPLYVVAPPPVAPKLAFTPLVVMAGDEHQLGPRTAAPTTPLQRSLFARLFARPVYAEHPLARGKTGKQPPPLSKAMLPILRPAFTNLIRNYRSHPAILAVPSNLFYFDTLEPEASDTNRLASWDAWRGRRWPVLFHDNQSPDDLERDAGGWYNAGEAELACNYASRLVASGLVKQHEICIMSPFKAQVARVRKTNRRGRYGLWEVNVGPTEAFQGLEHGVVILCVTRSRRRFVEKDKALGWGVIGMPNKMNVALTRAKFGLIIIGDRDVLVGDPNWKAVLDFCDRNGLTVGGEGGETGGAAQAARASTRQGQLTRIEKVLMASDPEREDSRVLGGRSDKRDAW